MTVIKRTVQDTGSVTMGTSKITQTTVDIPNHGDVRAVMLELTQQTDGTLVTANKMSRAIDSIKISDKNGNPLWANIRGRDLRTLHNYGNSGQNIAETDTANSNSTDLFYVPFRIDKSAYPLRLDVTVAPYTDMAASGETGGTVTIITSFVYDDSAENTTTEMLHRIEKSGNSGTNSFAPDILKNKLINNTYFVVGTEGDVTNVTFSRDGSLEMDELTVNQLTAIENAILIDGHQTGIFQLYHSPYVAKATTRLDFTLSAAETIDLFFRMEQPK